MSIARIKYKLSEAIREQKCKRERAKKGYCTGDLWSIKDWFVEIMPRMLADFKKDNHGIPMKFEVQAYEKRGLDFMKYVSSSDDKEVQKIQEECSKEAFKAWQDTIDKMIFLFKECQDETCTRKNKYEEEYLKAFYEFDDKYGLLGEGLLSDKEKEEQKATGTARVHFMEELPEYKDIHDKWHKEETKLDRYKDKCKKQAIKLFVENLEELWW